MALDVRIETIKQYEDEGFFEEALGKVSPYRREKVLRLKFESSKRQSLGAGWLLERMLAESCGIPQGSAEFSMGKDGKPSLTGRDDIKFNLSHTKSAVMAVVAKSEEKNIISVGCDIEEIKYNRNLKVADRFFNESEIKYIYEADDDRERAERFIRLWVLKESVMKATGLGMRLGLSEFEIEIGKDDSVTLKRIKTPDDYKTEGKIKLMEIGAPTGCRAAVCVIERD